MHGIEKRDQDTDNRTLTSQDSPDELRRVLVRLYPELRARARFLTQGGAAADDLVHDVVERALLAGYHFQRGANVKAWLNAIMKNLFIDGHRERSKRLHTEVPGEPAPISQPVSALDFVTMDDVVEALAWLEPGARKIFTLAYLEHMSYRDISVRLGIPVNTVGTRLLRVRGTLRRLLARVHEVRKRTFRSSDEDRRGRE